MDAVAGIVYGLRAWRAFRSGSLNLFEDRAVMLRLMGKVVRADRYEIRSLSTKGGTV